MRKSILVIMIFALILSAYNVTCFSEGATKITIDKVDAPNTEQIQDYKQIKADSDEIKNSFNSEKEIMEHLSQKNKSHTRDELNHNIIQKELENSGIIGLSKYQYAQLLLEEQPENMVPDELIIMFNPSGRFSKKEFADYFVSFESSEQIDFAVLGKLKKAYQQDELLTLIQMLINDPNIEMIQPNFYHEYASSSAYVTADYTYTLTRAMEQVNATAAWNYYTGQNVMVGMIDSGINDYANLTLHPNTINDDCSENTCVGHGTAVATVIGGDNEYTGVAPNSTIYCSSLGHSENHSSGVKTTWDTNRDIANLLNAGCRIINMSINDFGNESPFSSIITSNPNILIIHSAGNRGLNLSSNSAYTYHSKPNYIRVASVDMNDKKVNTSNYGTTRVHIAAPGQNLSLPTRDGDLHLTSGTSFSAPFVSGTAALLLEADPTLTASELKNIILNTADNVPGLTSTIQNGRRLNVMAAVSAVDPPTGERYAYITSGGALYARDNSIPIDSDPILIASNVKNAQLGPKGILYQTTNNYLYFRPGALNSASICLDNTGDVVSYSASWNNLVVYNSDNTLDRYIHGYNPNETYLYDVTHRNVLKYALSGNRLALFYSTSAKFRIYENIQMYSNYEIYSAVGTINSLWSFGTRLHVYQNDGKYQLFDSISSTKPTQHHDYEVQNETNRKWLGCVYTDTDFSFLTSMNEYRWCTAEGASVYVYGFTGNGQMESTPNVRTDAGNQTITGCKLVDYRVYYTVGSNFYSYEGNSSSQLHLLDVPISTFVCCGDNIGIVDRNDGKFKVKSGELNAYWSTIPNAVNPKAIYVSY